MRNVVHPNVVRPNVVRPNVVLLLYFLLSPFAAHSVNFPTNTWVPLPDAGIQGERRDIPFAYAPDSHQFLVLGGRTSWTPYKSPRPYDVLALDLSVGQWENEYPIGKNWGPQFGLASAPAWQDEYWRFLDTEGNVRPNWTIYGTFSIATGYGYDPVSKKFIFYAGGSSSDHGDVNGTTIGSTFSYDPASRLWHNLAPAQDPQNVLGGGLMWGSMCYDSAHKRFVLFGGGNMQTNRGDPGTWVYDPAANTWTQLNLAVQPPARANSQLVYDPVAQKVVLFGGDALDQLLADTWVFDGSAWTQRMPAVSPSPRAGHAMVWLPQSKKILLLGGYSYDSSPDYVGNMYGSIALESWVYDTAANQWSLIAHYPAESQAPGLPHPYSGQMGLTKAAANENDLVILLTGNQPWGIQMDATHSDAAGTATYGVTPGTVVRRTGPYDPAWYQQDVPPPDPVKTETDLASLQPNVWVQRSPPKTPKPDMTWGSAVFSPELDLIMRFSGGHSAYSGTAPQVYDVKTNRYSIPFAPEFPIDYIYTNDQLGGEWSFKGNPWMRSHTYKANGYDVNLKSMVFTEHSYTFFFNPLAGPVPNYWTHSTTLQPFIGIAHNTMISTPQGVVAWGVLPYNNSGLFRLNPADRTWVTLPLTGTLPAQSFDQHGAVYDSKRNRLLFFSAADPDAGNVWSYDSGTGVLTKLNPSNQSLGAVASREPIYIPEFDVVLIAARRQDTNGKYEWVTYDCANNTWFLSDLSGSDPIDETYFGGSFSNSVGLMYDPNRRLVWAVDDWDDVYVMKYLPVAGALDTTPPSTPAHLVASAVSPAQINLSWTASTDNVSVAGYKLFRGGTQIGSTANTTYQDAGLTPQTAYSYTVKAYDSASNESGMSNSASATTPTSAGPPTLQILAPAANATVSGNPLTVTYSKSGDLFGIDRVYFQLDLNATVGDPDFDGAFAFSNVAVGTHTLIGYLAKTDNSKISGTDVSVFFTVSATALPPDEDVFRLNVPSVLPLNATISVHVPTGWHVDHFEWEITAAAQGGGTPENRQSNAAVSGSFNQNFLSPPFRGAASPGNPTLRNAASLFPTKAPAMSLASLNLTPGQYTITVTAFRDASSTNILGSDSKTTMLVLADLSSVKVYPNPWRSDKHQGGITFSGLPSDSSVKIFTTSGHLVRRYDHVTGQVVWDRANESGDTAASGVYVYVITTPDGAKKRGKLGVIK